MKTFEDADLEALLNIDSYQTHQELVDLLEITKQINSIRLKCLDRTLRAVQVEVKRRTIAFFHMPKKTKDFYIV